MKLNNLIDFIKEKSSESNFFNLAIILLPSAPSIASIVLLLIGICSTKKSNNYFRDIWNISFLICSFFILLSCLSNTLFRDDIYIDQYNIVQIWLGLANWIPYFWIFWIFQRFSFNELQRRRFGFFLLVGSIPVLISGLLQYFFNFHGPFIFLNGIITWYSRNITPMEGMTGLFSNANYLGIWLNILWPFSIVYFVNNKDLPKKRFLSISFLIGIFICTILTFSRNAWMGMLLASILILGLRSLRWIFPLLMLSVVPVLMGLGLISEKFIGLGEKLVPKIILNNTQKTHKKCGPSTNH